MSGKRSIPFGKYKREAHCRKLQESKETGVNTNFTQIDNELIFVYDPESGGRYAAFPHIPGPVKYLYVVLKTCCINDKDFCYPTREYLADITGYSVKSIERYLEVLEKHHLISITQYRCGSKIKNVYIVNRIDKLKTYENLIFFKNQQPETFSPSTDSPDISYSHIAKRLYEYTGDTWVYAGEKSQKEKRQQERDARSRFSQKTDSEDINNHGQIDRDEDKQDTEDHG